jgi:GntR family transcriptional regulator
MTPLKHVNRDEFKPLYAQISEQIVEYIEDNALETGAPLPSQNDLIKHYGVSTMTIRIAMQRLETDGIIKRIRGKGTFVAEKKMIETVSGIQSLEDRLAKGGFTIQNQFVESYSAQPVDRIRADLNLSGGDETFKIRRLKLLNDLPVGLETRHFPLNVANKLEEKKLKCEPFVNLLNQFPDLELSRIRYNTRASLASELEAGLLSVETGYPVLVQYGVFYNKKDVPIMAGKVTYLADKIELEYQVSDRGVQNFNVLI